METTFLSEIEQPWINVPEYLYDISSKYSYIALLKKFNIEILPLNFLLLSVSV